MILQGELKSNARWKIALVVSRFNPPITEELESGASQRLAELGLGAEQIVRVRVPGAFEIPLVAQRLLEGDCDAVIALGAVIQGDTKHFDYVCNAVERGCSEAMLKTGKPVVFGILTTNTEEQAFARIGGEHGHKGRDAAEVAVEMLQLMDRI